MSRSTLGEPRPWLRRSAWLTGLSAAGMVAASCSTAAPIAREARAEKPVSPSPQPVVVLHTNDNWGEVEPCGWGANATGGFRRRATLIQREREALAEQIGTGTPRMLLLDTGDALVGGGTLGDATQGEAIVAAMNQVGYDVMALGTRELGLGADVLRARIAEAEFPVVSANVAADDGRELVKPYALLDVGGHRVGVIGLTREPAEKISGFEVTDPSAALATWLPELAQAANTIVVLTNLDLEQAKAVAGGAAGVNLVVAANPLRVPMQAERLTDTNALLVAAEKPAPRHTGRRVGRLSATLQSDGSLSDDSWESIWLEKTLPDDPAMTTLLESFE